MKHTYEEFKFKKTYGRFPSAGELKQVRDYNLSNNRLVEVRLVNDNDVIAVPIDTVSV